MIDDTSEGRKRQTLAAAVHQEVGGRLNVIDADRDDDRLRALGARAQNLETVNLAVIALGSPVAEKILVGIRFRRLPELVGVLVIARLEGGEKVRYRALLLQVAQQDIAHAAQNNQDHG